MQLKDNICRRYYLRDTDTSTLGHKQTLSPFLMSVDNEMDLGDVPAYLLALTQIEEMVIARAHVQMLLKRVQGHQYQYIGHCVSFIQNIVKIVDVLPNLLSELDVVLLQPSENLTGRDLRYRRQFQADFQVCRGHVLTWLCFLKAHYLDYRYITISSERLNVLPIDDNVSLSVTSITNDAIISDKLVQDDSGLAPAPPNSQSVVLNLNINTIEADLILQEIIGQKALPTGVLALSIR